MKPAMLPHSLPARFERQGGSIAAHDGVDLYRGRDAVTQRQVAIRVLGEDADEARRTRFAREATRRGGRHLQVLAFHVDDEGAFAVHAWPRQVEVEDAVRGCDGRRWRRLREWRTAAAFLSLVAAVEALARVYGTDAITAASGLVDPIWGLGATLHPTVGAIGGCLLIAAAAGIIRVVVRKRPRAFSGAGGRVLLALLLTVITAGTIVAGRAMTRVDRDALSGAESLRARWLEAPIELRYAVVGLIALAIVLFLARRLQSPDVWLPRLCAVAAFVLAAGMTLIPSLIPTAVPPATIALDPLGPALELPRPDPRPEPETPRRDEPRKPDAGPTEGAASSGAAAQPDTGSAATPNARAAALHRSGKVRGSNCYCPGHAGISAPPAERGPAPEPDARWQDGDWSGGEPAEDPDPVPEGDADTHTETYTEESDGTTTCHEHTVNGQVVSSGCS